jgi:magnesium-transporting ATPase (P-type)
MGDATETALLRYVTAAGIDVGTLRSDSPHAVEVPFSSDRKWAAGVFNKAHAAGFYTVYLKVHANTTLLLTVIQQQRLVVVSFICSTVVALLQ